MSITTARQLARQAEEARRAAKQKSKHKHKPNARKPRAD